MAIAVNVRAIAQDTVRDRLAAIDGTAGRWTYDVEALGEQTRPWTLEQITAEMTPWCFATVTVMEITTLPSNRWEGYVEVEIYLVVRSDQARFPNKASDQQIEDLITDVRSAIEASPVLPGVDSWLQSVTVVEKDLDQDNDAWGFAIVRVRYAVEGVLGQ